jgi:hypothetical protein
MSTQAPCGLDISTFTHQLHPAEKILNKISDSFPKPAMKASRLLVGLCLSNGGLAVGRRQIFHPPNGTALQPKQYILEFQPVSS